MSSKLTKYDSSYLFIVVATKEAAIEPDEIRWADEQLSKIGVSKTAVIRELHKRGVIDRVG